MNKSFEVGRLYFCANRILFAYGEWYKPSSFMIPYAYDNESFIRDGIETYTELLSRTVTTMKNFGTIHGMTNMFIVEPAIPFLLLKHNQHVLDHNDRNSFFRDEHLEILYEEKTGIIFPKRDVMFQEFGK